MTILDSVILDLINQVNQIEEQLGLDPNGVYSDVRVRLDILESRINNPFAPSPNVPNPFTIGFDGITISTGAGAPTENRLSGSLYLRTDGYADEGVYSRRPDGYWHKVAGGGGGVQALTNIAALSAVVVTSSDDGALSYILSVKDLWVYHTSSTLIPDGITVVAANGPGNWERANLGSVEWRARTVWYIDPAAGNDENDGLTSGTALKTWAELNRRWGKNPKFGQQITINLLGNIPPADALSITGATNTDTIFIVGQRTILASGTLTNYTSYLPGTSMAIVEDTVLGSFAPYLFKRIRFTSGGALGAVAWIVRDELANNASISVSTLILGASAPSIGDSYVIEDLSTVAIDRIDVFAPGNSIFNFTLSDMKILNFGGESSYFGCTGTIFGCDISPSFASGNSMGYLLPVGSALSPLFDSVNIQATQCVSFLQSMFLNSYSYVLNHIAVGTETLFVDSGSIINTDTVGIFDYSNIGVEVVNGGIINVQDFGYGGQGLWGNNVGYGYSVSSGGQIITGSSESSFPVPSDWLHIGVNFAEAVIDGITKSGAELPFTNKYTGSAIHSWDIYGPGGISNILTPATLISNQNDYNGGGDSLWARAEIVYLSSTASWDITGFLAVASDINRKTIINNGSFNIVLKNQDGGSSLNNRIITTGGGDITLQPNDAVEICYDNTAARWRII